MAEGPQWGPVLFEPRASPTGHNRAYIAASRRHPALEATRTAHRRTDPVGTHNDIGPQLIEAEVGAVLRGGGDPHRSARIRAHRDTPKTRLDRSHAANSLKQ